MFVVGLGMLVSGVAFKATMIGSFPILSVFGFIVMFGGVVYAVTGRRLSGRPDHGDRRPVHRGSVAQRERVARSPVAWRTGSGAASTSSRRDSVVTG